MIILFMFTIISALPLLYTGRMDYCYRQFRKATALLVDTDESDGLPNGGW